MTSKFLTILENIKNLKESGELEKADKSNTEENLLLIP